MWQPEALKLVRTLFTLNIVVSQSRPPPKPRIKTVHSSLLPSMTHNTKGQLPTDNNIPR